MKNPSGREIQVGIRSVRANAAPIEIGRATMSAINEDCNVPTMMARAPKLAPSGWATPSVWTVAP